MPDETVSRAERTITRHAREKMAERGVPEAAVDWVLEHYDLRRPAPVRYPGSPADILIGDWNGRRLKVYVLRGIEPPIITTTTWEG